VRTFFPNLFCLLLLNFSATLVATASDKQLATKIEGVWIGREIVYASEVEIQTTYRSDGTLQRLAIFTEGRRRYKLIVKSHWKVEQGQLISDGDSFSGQTEHAIDEIIAVTDKNLLLRAENGRLIHLIRK
jgi:hypothetical protein